MLSKLRKHRKTAAIIAIAITCTSFSATAMAANGWLDDWFSSKTSSGPDYFQGQQRGYATGGSLNARWGATVATNPISVAPPKFKAGCGGIDAFGGSISFLSADMLVKKLQKILQNSAGVAFDMALQTLCPKCSDIMKSMEQLSNALNGMALDDCKAAKGIAVALKSQAEKAMDVQKSNMGDQNADNNWYEGTQQLSEAFAAAGKSVNGFVNDYWGKASNNRSELEGCPADWSQVFPGTSGLYPTTFMEMAVSDSTAKTNHIPMIRGLIGDIVVDIADNDEFIVTELPPCSQNQSITFEQILTDDFYIRTDPGEECVKAAPGTASFLVTWAKTRNENIKNAMVGKTALLQPEIDYIKGMPTAVHYALRMAVASEQFDTISFNLANVGASQYLLKSLQEMTVYVGKERDLIQKVSRRMANKSDKCDLSNVIAQLETVAGNFTVGSRDGIKALNELGDKSISGFLQSMNYAVTMQESMKKVDAAVGKSFGPGVASRIRSKIKKG